MATTTATATTTWPRGAAATTATTATLMIFIRRRLQCNLVVVASTDRSWLFLLALLYMDGIGIPGVFLGPLYPSFESTSFPGAVQQNNKREAATKAKQKHQENWIRCISRRAESSVVGVVVGTRGDSK